MATFKERLKELRTQRKLSQQELADKINLTKQTISQYERGVREPDYENLSALCDVFNVSTDYMLGKDDVTMRLLDADGIKAIDAYYTNPETARLAQEMFEDPQMRSLYHMKRNMEPEKFAAHYDMLKKMYQLEHPEDGDDWA